MQWTNARLQRFFFGSFVLLLAMRFYEGLWFMQLLAPPFHYVSADNFYWLLHILTLPQTWIQSNYLTCLAEPLLLLIALAKIARPQWMLPNYVFAPLFTLYFTTFNSVQTHHAHDMLGFFFLGWGLVFARSSYFPFVWKALRYYFCFAMLSAALWKIGRGSVFEIEQMSRILQQQHLHLLQYPDSHPLSSLYAWLIEHPTWSWSLLLFGTFLELLFVIGFFTKRYDRLLLVALLLFFAGDYLLLNLSFIAFLIFGLLLIPLKSDFSSVPASLDKKPETQTFA